MPNDPSHKQPFAARLFQSSAIKSWKAEHAEALRRALWSTVDALQKPGSPLVFDLLVDVEAESLEPTVNASKVIHWRSRPSKEFGAHVRRLLGFYSGESTLAAALELARAEQLEALLRGNVIWDCELAIYPVPKKPLYDLPDPHFDVVEFSGQVPWAVMQKDTGTDTWLVTALDPSMVVTLCEVLKRAFEQQGLSCSTMEAPSFTAPQTGT